MYVTIDDIWQKIKSLFTHPGPQTGCSDWEQAGAEYDWVSSKHQTIYGYKLHLLMTLSGIILDFEFAPANQTDLAVGLEMLEHHANLEVLGDKAYISQAKPAELEQTNQLKLKTLPRLNQKRKVSEGVRHLFNRARQIVETVNGQLAG